MSEMILFNELTPLIKYFPMKIGNAEIRKDGSTFFLSVDGVPWCSLSDCSIEVRQLFLEINLAEGDVITTGLGFGILQTHLLTKKNVRSLTVFEKSKEVIEIFKETCGRSGFDISRLNIINDDANNMNNMNCDWLLMDHFEFDAFWEKIDSVRLIASNNYAKNVWFWSTINCFLYYANAKQTNYSVQTFNRFVDTLKINNFYRVSEIHLEYFRKVVEENFMFNKNQLLKK